MKAKRSEEIAESFVNGNISWVREQIKNKRGAYVAVLDAMRELFPNEVPSFERLIGRK